MECAQINKQMIEQLSEMFSEIPYILLLQICEQKEWKLEECIEYITTKIGNMRSDCPTTKIPNVQGAIPKINLSKLQKKSLYYNSVNCSETDECISNFHYTREFKIVQQILAGYQIMIIMRGPPGCGKSHLAKALLEKCKILDSGYSVRDFIFGTDDFFCDANGQYKYRADQLDAAHAYNQKRVQEKANAGWSPIIVDNTNIKLWEMLPYAKIAVNRGYMLEFFEPNTPWRLSIEKLTMKNKHRVPYEKIKVMMERFEKGTVNDVLKMLKGIKYSVTLPQLRKIPAYLIIQDVLNLKDEFQKFENTYITNSDQQLILAKSKCQSYGSDGPETQRENSRMKNNNSNNGQNSPISLMNSKAVNLKPCNNRQLEKASTFWFYTKKHVDQTCNNYVAQNSSRQQRRQDNVFDLLREKRNTTPMADKMKIETILEKQITLERHNINCNKENKSFVALRQIYPNKSINGLWDLFVKCDGVIDRAIVLLLKDRDLCSANDNVLPVQSTETFYCKCDKIASGKEVQVPSKIYQSNGTTVSIKSQQQRQYAQPTHLHLRTKGELQELKNSVENRFTLANDHYSDHIYHIQGTRNITSNYIKKQYNVQTQTSFVANEREDDKMIEISLSDDLIDQLKATFKLEISISDILPKKVTSKTFVPRTLAKKLYLLWVESALNKIEIQNHPTIQEDEDFARLLKLPKYQDYKQSSDNIREFLDMELLRMNYKTRQEAFIQDTSQVQRSLTPRMSKIQLSDSYPHIPIDTLHDIFSGHNHKYNDTLEYLQRVVKAYNEPEEDNQMVIKNQMQGNINTHRKMDLRYNTPPLTAKEKKRIALCNFEKNRNLAAHYTQLKAECYQKARETIQKGNTDVALYYSQIANLHKQKTDHFNHHAANYIMDVHRFTQNNPDLLDLHYLHTPEAVGCLDLFLDRHISSLRTATKNYKNLFVITGRGLHSIGGVATIKNKVKCRLKDRNLRWNEVNPGLLKIRIFSGSRHSTAM